MKSNSRVTASIRGLFSIAVAISVIAGNASAEVFFADDFESGDLLKSQNGFQWNSTNQTSVVRDDGYFVWDSWIDTPDGPYPDREWENGPGSSGRHALRFRYRAGVEGDYANEQTYAWSEQRFDLGGVYPELWISYWLKVPINYVHGSISRSAGSSNQKFFALWTNNYGSNNTPLVVFNMWDKAEDWNVDGTDGSSYSTVSIGGATNMYDSHETPYNNFIAFPQDQGRWMHVVARYKIASSYGAEDGVVQWWRRWSNETSYTVISDRKNLGIGVESGPAGFTAGYLMGWANGWYTEETEFLIDDFKLSTTSLLPNIKSPKPPTLVQ